MFLATPYLCQNGNPHISKRDLTKSNKVGKTWIFPEYLIKIHHVWTMGFLNNQPNIQYCSFVSISYRKYLLKLSNPIKPLHRVDPKVLNDEHLVDFIHSAYFCNIIHVSIYFLRWLKQFNPMNCIKAFFSNYSPKFSFVSLMKWITEVNFFLFVRLYDWQIWQGPNFLCIFRLFRKKQLTI